MNGLRWSTTLHQPAAVNSGLLDFELKGSIPFNFSFGILELVQYLSGRVEEIFTFVNIYYLYIFYQYNSTILNDFDKIWHVDWKNPSRAK